MDFYGDYFQFCYFLVEVDSEAEFMPAFGILLSSVYHILIHTWLIENFWKFLCSIGLFWHSGKDCTKQINSVKNYIGEVYILTDEAVFKVLKIVENVQSIIFQSLWHDSFNLLIMAFMFLRNIFFVLDFSIFQVPVA